MELGTVLNEYLRKLGCTAKVLADTSGISPIQLSRWRNGSRRPSDEMVRNMNRGELKQMLKTEAVKLYEAKEAELEKACILLLDEIIEREKAS